MNKYGLTLSLVIIVFSVFGQKKVKKYDYSGMWESATLELTSDNLFKWNRSNCLGTQLASGEYTIEKNKLILKPKTAYRFSGDSYDGFLKKNVIDSCCNVTLNYTKARNNSDSLAIYNLYSDRVDSCLLKNMTCIMTSDKLDKFEKRSGFKTKFTWTDFAMKGQKLILIMDNKETNWILKKRR